jgi:hypothetical protein
MRRRAHRPRVKRRALRGLATTTIIQSNCVKTGGCSDRQRCLKARAAINAAPHPTAPPIGHEPRHAALRNALQHARAGHRAEVHEAFWVGAARPAASWASSPLNWRLQLAGASMKEHICLVRATGSVARS